MAALLQLALALVVILEVRVGILEGGLGDERLNDLLDLERAAEGGIGTVSRATETAKRIGMGHNLILDNDPCAPAVAHLLLLRRFLEDSLDP
jgi:hypothetical protein